MEPKTLIEAVRHFADEKVCFDYMVNLKWPDGKITCPKCGCDRIGKITSRNMLQCKSKECRKQFSAKLGTIFEDSPLPLSSWFVAVWCIANAKNGISSCELGRALGVTQKTAWFMLHRIRLAMRTPTFRKFDGTVESDETFVGGKAENMHAAKRARRIKGRGAVGKETLLPIIARNVERGANVYTDAAAVYSGLSYRYIHQFVDHATRYASGLVHTNGLENFWSLVKRMIRGTYVAVAPFHLQGYLDEEIFRFNERKDDDGGRFKQVMAGVLGKRITYRRLCMIDGEGFFDPIEG